MTATPPVVALTASGTFAQPWDRSLDGDEAARAELGALYARHAQAVHRFLGDLLGDTVLAADATQEVFVRAFGRLASLEDRSRAGAWLFGIARNVSREYRKARRRAGQPLDAAPEPQTHAGAPSPERALLDREAVGIVSAALSRLSFDRREVLLLRLDHGLSYDQIAELTGWSLAKVKVEIFRAREQLREALQRYEGGAP